MKRTLLCVTCAVAVLSLATFLQSAEKELFSLSIAPVTETVKSGADVRLCVRVTNTSDRIIGFIRSLGIVPEEGFRYQIEVRNSDGLPAPPSARVLELRKKQTVDFASNVARWLKPGESFVDEIDVTKLVDLSLPGTYTISVTREFPPAQNLGEGRIKSNSATVKVVR